MYRTNLVRILSTTVVALGMTAIQSGKAEAYPIDCAILLCMAGGFPASAECTAAKVEVIRRITPIPVEPPLQIWRCPMGIDANVASLIGLPLSQINEKGYTKEVLDIQNAIEIYDVNYRVIHNSDGGGHSDTTKKNLWGGDNMSWVRASYINGPDWLASATGGYRKNIYEYRGNNMQNRVLVRTENAANFSFRAIVMRWRDIDGNYATEFVRY